MSRFATIIVRDCGTCDGGGRVKDGGSWDHDNAVLRADWVSCPTCGGNQEVGLAVVVEYECEDGERPTRWEPGCGESAAIAGVWLARPEPDTGAAVEVELLPGEEEVLERRALEHAGCERREKRQA